MMVRMHIMVAAALAVFAFSAATAASALQPGRNSSKTAKPEKKY
jgi:hypothetical protein